MVGTTGGAGNLTIKGSLDTSLIERGFMRVKQSFASVKGFTNSFNSDLIRMGQEAKKVAGNLFKVGGAGATAMITLASKAPAVAPAMAKMGVAFGKIQRNLGEGLAPAFEKVSGWLDKIAAWSGDHPNIFAGLVGALSGIAALKFVGATGLLTSLAKFIIKPATLTALGYLAVIGGAAYAGAKGLEFVSEKTRDFLTERAEQIPGTLPSLRDVDQSASEIAARGFQPTPGGTISAREEDRRFFLLAWWDALWG